MVDLQENSFKLLPIKEILQEDFPYRPYLLNGQTNQLTFDHLTQDKKFVRLMRTALTRLEKTYGKPVQFEFALEINDTPSGADYKLYILQCHTVT